MRSVRKWDYSKGYGKTIRVHVGLEDPLDLIDSLEGAFNAMAEFQDKRKE